MILKLNSTSGKILLNSTSGKIYLGTPLETTDTPTIGTLTCSTSGDVFVIVNNQDSVGGTAEVSYTSNFAAGTVYSDTVAGSNFVSIAIPGYSNPPGNITVYARVTATGKNVSATASRTQNLTVCLQN